MSASISSTASSAAATTLSDISAWLSQAAAYSLNTSAEAASPSSATAAGDVVSFSPHAQMLFEALSVLNSNTSQNLQGSYSGSYGNVSASVTGGSGAKISAFVNSFQGSDTSFVNVTAGSGVENITAVNNSSSGDPFGAITNITLNGNNDTVNATSNGLTFVQGTTGNYNITINSTGQGVGVADNGTGNSTISINGAGEARAVSGNNTIYLDDTATASLGNHGAALAWLGSGNNTVIGTGRGNIVVSHSGNLTASGIDELYAGSGTDTVSLSGGGYDVVNFGSNASTDTINLSSQALPSGLVLSNLGPPEGETDSHGRVIGVLPDANGNYNGSAETYTETPPTEGQAGYGLTHTNLNFQGTADQFTSQLDGSTLTISNASTGQNVTLNNYQAGLVTFSFGDGNGNLTASREPPGLTSDSTATTA